MPVRECNAWYTNCEVVDEVGVVFFQLQSIPHSHRNNLNKHKIYAKQCVVKKCQKTGIKIGKRWHFGGKYPSWEMSTISSMWFFSIHFNSVHRPLWLAIQTEDPVQLLKNCICLRNAHNHTTPHRFKRVSHGPFLNLRSSWYTRSLGAYHTQRNVKLFGPVLLPLWLEAGFAG